MAEQISDSIKDTIGKLEARIAHLEARLAGKSGADEGMRMILIGPPGAGMCSDRSLKPQPNNSQARAHKHRSSRKSTVSATWYESDFIL